MDWQIISDEPLTPGEVLPDDQDLARHLADVVVTLPFTAPLLVCGDWGCGKTSLLLRMQRRLEGPPGREPETPTVWFNAWHHEGEESLLPALLRAVWLAAPERYRVQEQAKAGFLGLWQVAKRIGLHALPLLVPQLALAAGVAVAAKDGAKELRETAEKLLGDAEKLPAPSLAVIEVDPVAALRKRFRDMVKGAWEGATPVVFIDDLDRCSPAGAVELVDAIKTLVHHAEALGCRFVVAVDKAVVVRAISQKFEHIDGYDGNRYLEKVFPIEVHVPAMDEAAVFAVVEAVLGALPRTDRALDVGWHQALRAVFKPGPFANPRLIKRTVNRLLLLSRIEPPAGAHGRARVDRTLVEWIVATERWPALRRLVAAYDNATLAGAFEVAVGGARPVADPDLQLFVSDRGAQSWLRAVRNQTASTANRVEEFRQAEQRLRRCGL